MNLRVISILAVIVLLVTGSIYFSQSFTKTSAVQPQQKIEQQVNSATEIKKYTIEEVAMHKDATSCWAVINGKVYDLTSWISQHPGGPDRIISICGTDGSDAFNAQHGSDQKPADQLVAFYIGDLSSQ